MKKLFAILLAVAVICALSVTAFAAAGSDTISGAAIPADPDNKVSITVQGIYSAAAADIHAYKVDIEWGAMAFKYTPAQKQWDTTDHNWEDVPGGGWSCVTEGNNTITVKNHSSKAIDATFAFAAASGFTGINGEFTGLTAGKLNVLAPTAGASDPVSGTVSFMPNAGTLTNAVDQLTDIGTITVTIADAA